MAASSDEAAARPAEEDHRANIFDFFRSHNAFDMLPESGKVVLLDSSVSAYAAFCIMSSNEQVAVPVWDSRNDQYMGMLTVTDMLEMVLMCQNSKAGDGCTEGMQDMTLHHWITNYPRPPGCPDVSVEVHPDDDLMVVLKTLIRNDSRVLPVLERDVGGELLQNCLIGQVSYMLLFRFLYFHEVEDLTTLSESLSDVGIGTFPAKKVITVKASDTVEHALSLMSNNGISGVPVLSEEGLLINLFCDTDLLPITSFALETTVMASLAQSRPRQHQEVHKFSCSASDRLSVVVTKFAESRLTRLVCIDADGRVEGIVTLTDLFKFLAVSA